MSFEWLSDIICFIRVIHEKVFSWYTGHATNKSAGTIFWNLSIIHKIVTIRNKNQNLHAKY